MATNPELVHVAVAGKDGTASAAFFAPAGTEVPSDAADAVSTLDPAFLDLGYVGTDGMTLSTDTESEDIDAFGSFATVRRVISKETRSFTVVGLETNAVSQAIQYRLPLTGADAPVVDSADGSFTVDAGEARSVRYAAVFFAEDGDDLIVYCYPNIELAEVGDETASRGAAVQYEFTFTAYPDSDGKAVIKHVQKGALAAS